MGEAVSTLVTFEAGWRSGVGGLAVVMGFLSLRCCLRRRLPAFLEVGWRAGGVALGAWPL
jgi:hypothetical protein